ncbi:Uncharacterised protein [BD1-7 clade bacterium]|uniref:DUF1554 domain-containing protein n=1 Tax=BD1-7 clade bacterium TaxID=2029982 RepID=A0A5S9NQ56_9GAMM|nr:Uncharacterised protein [BD1-7 clade bacterium]
MKSILPLTALFAAVVFSGCVPEVKTDIKPAEEIEKIIFVTSSTYIVSDFGSLVGADTLCQNVADNEPSLSGTFKAVMSDSTVDAISHLSSLGANVVIKNTNGDAVATGSADLWDGSIDAGVNYFEDGTTDTDNDIMAFTGTSGAGVNLVNLSCANWNDTGDFAPPAAQLGWLYKRERNSPIGGIEPAVVHLDTKWINGFGINCSGSSRLICLEQ